jgi:outer membrane protein OmpA-like peptidoglycan-associated protein
MSTLKPFEFGKHISHTQSEVGSFLTSNPLKINFPWFKYLVIGGLILGFTSVLSVLYESKNIFENLFSQHSILPTSVFSGNKEEGIEQLKLANSNPLPKLEAAISRNELNGEWIVLDEVRFATGTARLMDARQLNGVAALLMRNPSIVIKVGGFTESGGNDAKNIELSAQRAMNVAQKLANLGVSTENLYYEGFGSSMPLCSDELSESCKALNRRVALLIISN